MRPEAAALVWDAHRAAGRVGDFCAGLEWAGSREDVLVRSAVERQFQIVGEALGRLARADPETAVGIEDLPRIVASRNVLVHGYAVIDDALVWEVATVRAPLLRTQLEALLAGAAP